jgi:uncharacterized protein (TIGR04255 family)
VPDVALPSFDHPPIVEVVAAVKFERLPAEAIAHLGAFWKSILSDEFPRVQSQPPYAAPIERFGRDVLVPPFTLALDQDFPAPRLWFLNESGDELVQLQLDWLACNWRKVSPDAEYGRWPARRAAFVKAYEQLNSYLSSIGAGAITPQQCEVTYVNHIRPSDTWKDHRDLHKVLNIVGDLNTPSRVSSEQATVNHQFQINNLDGEVIGRLHVVAKPAYIENATIPIYVLELTARGAPLSPSLEGVLAFLDRGREAIVTTFAAVTSEDLQREWGVHDISH